MGLVREMTIESFKIFLWEGLCLTNVIVLPTEFNRNFKYSTSMHVISRRALLFCLRLQNHEDLRFYKIIIFEIGPTQYIYQSKHCLYA
jgi:hypothetical protein